MKNWIMVYASIAGATVFYFVAYPITSVIMVCGWFMLPEKIQSFNLALPWLLYFVLFYAYFWVRNMYEKFKKQKTLMLSL